MSKSYSIDVTLQAPGERNTIALIIKKGSEMGFVYYDSDFFSRWGDERIILSNEEAIHKILDNNEINANQGGAYVEVMFQDTQFMLRVFDLTSTTLGLYMSNFGYQWEGTFFGDVYFFDFGAYTEILLTLCKDFAVLKLETDILY